MTHQIKLLQNKLKQENLDGFLVTKDANIAYLSDYDSKESWLLVSQGGSFFITDFRYILEAKKNLRGIEVVKTEGSIFGCVAKLVNKLEIRRLGFESKSVSYAEFKSIKIELASDVAFISTFDFVESLRENKSQVEVSKIRKAVGINMKVLEFAKGALKPGLTEREAALRLEGFIKSRGADLAFDTIVASGPNSAMPHAPLTSRKLRLGEPVLIDIGVAFQGYRSDLTRMCFLGRIPVSFKRIYDSVLASQEAAIKNISAGKPICDIDRIARNFLNKRKLGKFFGHSLGHGVGRETHELPSISSRNKERLSSNMVFTVEPAVYLNGKFGIRIEDMVLVKKNNCEVLSGALDKSIKNWTNPSY
ncbi:MAG: aminopeptidase P family protein [Candidatus Omnitrophica bacterium]|nr:aminopeptidase P family protein [Candidatus Omnitrophota bacterium]